MAQQIIERVEAYYEVREVPFGITYEWHPAYVALECDCGEQLIITATTTITICRGCSADLGGFVHELKKREGHLSVERTHPWFYDSKQRAQQHQQDEAAYCVGSPWRYNDITAGP
jgi:hypothetical protein